MQTSISECIASTFDSLADEQAFEVDHRWIPWRDVANTAEAWISLCNSLGAPARARIGLVGRNRIEAASVFLGILKRGDCAVTINPFQPAGAIRDEIEQLDLSLLVAEHGDIEMFGLEAVASRLGLPLVCIGSLGAQLPYLCSGSAGTAREAASDCAFLIGTSGTSGKPKRIPIRYDTLLASLRETAKINVEFGEENLPPHRQPPLVQYSPLAHITGSLAIARAGVDGRRLVLLEKFSAQEWIRAVRTYKHRISGLPPAMMKMVLNEAPDPRDLESVTSIWSGSAPVDRDVVLKFEELYDVHVLGNYGATEYCGVIANDRLDERLKFGEEKRAAVGKIRRHVADFRIVDPESGEPVEGQGLLEVRVHRVGPDWMRTSDLASIDKDDYLYIHGRADDAINRGGFKIVPTIITDALKKHEAVEEAFALGLPDERLGQVPVAVVQPRKGHQVTADMLMAFIREKLVAYQVPKFLRVVDELPRTPSMKFDKRKMVELFDQDALTARGSHD